MHAHGFGHLVPFGKLGDPETPGDITARLCQPMKRNPKAECPHPRAHKVKEDPDHKEHVEDHPHREEVYPVEDPLVPEGFSATHFPVS